MGPDLLSVLGALNQSPDDICASKTSKRLHDLQLSLSLSTSGSTTISNHAHQLGIAGSPNLFLTSGCAREQFGCLNNRPDCFFSQNTI